MNLKMMSIEKRFLEVQYMKKIKEWVVKMYNTKVSSLYVAQVKAKHGLEMRDCYNKPRNENSRQSKVPQEKEKMIEEALGHFRLIEN